MRYRVQQFWSAARAQPLGPADLRLVSDHLPRAAVELFQTMPLGDQRHSLTVARALLAQGYRQRPLLQAALLHDVAKARVGLAHRTVVVVSNAISKKLVPRLASPNFKSWRYPFYLSWHHPELGAEAAARTGVDARALTLIRQHQSPLSATADTEMSEWRRALKLVDDQN